MRHLILGAMTVGLILGSVVWVHAHPLQCGPRDKMVESLANRYGEHPIGRGTQRNHMAEMFASESGSWTLLITPGDGLSCILGAGKGWDVIEAPIGEGA